MQDAVAWLQMFREPEGRVIELWKRTAKSRLQYIHSSVDGNKPNLNDVVNAWPRLSAAKGLLVGFI